MPGYQTKQENIAISGADDLIVRSLLNQQQFFDPHGEAERLGISSAAWPLFGLLWPSAAQLAACMVARPILAGERILEIGCGLALASMASHRHGADITASDCHPLAGSFLLENLRLNRLLPLPYRQGHWGAPDTVRGPNDEAPILQVEGIYDLIIGSDLLYERDVNAELARFIGRHVSPLAEVWIVDPDRSNRPAFNRQMADRGFVLHEERLDRVASLGVAAYKGRLLTYRLADAARSVT